MTSALAGKVVLVTGASKGIGAGIATAFGALRARTSPLATRAIRKAPSASRPRLEQKGGG
jgi:NAD(P)-dependent dehydrogenase (short-subunit alcohol dehydrogenase family)